MSKFLNFIQYTLYKILKYFFKKKACFGLSSKISLKNIQRTFFYGKFDKVGVAELAPPSIVVKKIKNPFYYSLSVNYNLKNKKVITIFVIIIILIILFNFNYH